MIATNPTGSLKPGESQESGQGGPRNDRAGFPPFPPPEFECGVVVNCLLSFKDG